MQWIKQKYQKGCLGLSYTDKHLCLVSLRRSQTAKPVVDLATITQTSVQQAPAIKHLVSQLAVKSLPCNAVLNVEQYQILQVDKPNMPANEIKLALRWKIKELIDYRVEQATVDGVDIPPDPMNPNRLPVMFSVCVKNSVVGELSNTLIDAGINLKSVDIHAMAQRNIASLLEFEQRALAMVSITERGCLVTFSAGGELYHTRFIELERGFSIDQSGTLFVTNIERLVLELQRSLDSFDRQFPYLSVNRLLVAPDPNSDRLVQALKSGLYVPVETFRLEDIVQLPPDQDFSSLEKQSMLLPALGAALRQEVST